MLLNANDAAYSLAEYFERVLRLKGNK